MFGLFQNTPQYAGSAQPIANSNGGALGFLQGLIAFPVTPKYATAASEPSTVTGAVFAPGASSDAATSEQVTAQPACSVPLPVAIVIQRSE